MAKANVLGMGVALITKIFGGSIKSSKKKREFGRAILYKKRNSLLLDKLKKSKKVRQQILLLKQDISKPDFGREN